MSRPSAFATSTGQTTAEVDQAPAAPDTGFSPGAPGEGPTCASWGFLGRQNKLVDEKPRVQPQQAEPFSPTIKHGVSFVQPSILMGD